MPLHPFCLTSSRTYQLIAMRHQNAAYLAGPVGPHNGYPRAHIYANVEVLHAKVLPVGIQGVAKA